MPTAFKKTIQTPLPRIGIRGYKIPHAYGISEDNINATTK